MIVRIVLNQDTIANALCSLELLRAVKPESCYITAPWLKGKSGTGLT